MFAQLHSFCYPLCFLFLSYGNAFSDAEVLVNICKCLAILLPGVQEDGNQIVEGNSPFSFVNKNTKQNKNKNKTKKKSGKLEKLEKRKTRPKTKNNNHNTTSIKKNQMMSLKK